MDCGGGGQGGCIPELAGGIAVAALRIDRDQDALEGKRTCVSADAV